MTTASSRTRDRLVDQACVRAELMRLVAPHPCTSAPADRPAREARPASLPVVVTERLPEGRAWPA